MEDNNGILLESGTNEFEIVEFSIDNIYYGINVAKVREIIDSVSVTPIVDTHPYVDGMFKLREKVMMIVNLAKCLSGQDTGGSHQVIVSELNGVFLGFKVDEVYRIHRISWTQMEPAPRMAGSDLVIGLVKIDERLIILLDFEKILSEIDPGINKKMTAVPAAGSDLVKIRNAKTVLIAEDSHMLRELLLSTLNAAGYNTIANDNGKQAWDKLLALAAEGRPVEEQVQLVITDIEMPQMDGHNLTKRIKENEKLKDLPVVIFSSLINTEMRRKGEALGAYAQITKPRFFGRQ